MPTKTINIELQQKWIDFTHPTKIEHYGYSFTESQLRQFPEGRMVLYGIKRGKLNVRQATSMVLPLVKQMRRTLDNLAKEVILAD